ncbi:P-protein [Oxobacter pfennigii]|uniref:Prephenate dehydratase n=1 Tax=Oxobacter pfennigii TaxID=36849 RepID=A0A0P8W9Z3_9CLOT|nr:prephenate dehydratase [Oxobacter pfennigii]KPU44785.1 P-protein [Oxobacter pfennigii]
MRIKVGFQGVPGSYSEEALINYFGREVDMIAVREFEDVFSELDKNTIEYGVLPIENSSTGAIANVYDLLNRHDYYIVGEICIKVSHCLMGVKGAKIDDIEEVYSHPQGLEQCREYLSSHRDWKLIPYRNTAVSAEYVNEKGSKSLGAIASKRAAELYNLEILAENINMNDTNYTRFAIIGKEMDKSESPDKISIVISTEHKAGCLYNVLKYFAENNINLLKIESRPVAHTPWEYYFYIDYEGNLNDITVINATKEIERNSCYFKLLGNYKKHVDDIEDEGLLCKA